MSCQRFVGVDVRRSRSGRRAPRASARIRVARLDHRRLDEEALAVVDAAADEDLGLARCARLLDRLAVRPASALPSMTAPMKFEKSPTSPIAIEPTSSASRSRSSGQMRFGDVDARGGRALLALVLERAAHDRGRDRVDVGARVRDDEVLAARLADDARVVPVVRDVARRSSSTSIWNTGVEPVKWTPASSGLASAASPIVGAGAVDEVDHAVGQARPRAAAASCSAPRARRSRRASRRPCCPSAPGARGRFPPIAVKLNGVTAKTKPSSGRYSMPVPDARATRSAAPRRSGS